MAIINKFSGRYNFLSNFYPCRIYLDGIAFPSVEHAFQAAKTLNIEERKNVAVCRTSAEAKKYGRNVELRNDWERVKVQIMLDLLRQKFQNVSLKELLISTEDAELVEGNTWNDTFWGVSNNTGSNMLGKLLMQVRSEISED